MYGSGFRVSGFRASAHVCNKLSRVRMDLVRAYQNYMMNLPGIQTVLLGCNPSDAKLVGYPKL